MKEIKENLENIKIKIKEQIVNQFPKEKSDEFLSKIDKMNDEQFIEFLKIQGYIPSEDSQSNCIFCALATNKIPRTEILEDDEAVAILELKPISKGHTLVIPKKHIKDENSMPETIKEMAKKVSEILNDSLHPQKIDIIPGNVMGHQVINVLPIYSLENMDSERSDQTPEGLKILKEEILNSRPKTIEEKEKPEIIEEEKPKEISTEEVWLPRKHMP